MTETIGGLELTILRGQRGCDWLYLPLRYRPEAADAESLRTQIEEARASLATSSRPETQRALAIADAPDASLICLAVNADQVVTHRIHLAAKQGHAAVFRQHPGATPDVGGDIDVSVTSQAAAAQLVAGYLPTVQAGRHPSFAVPAPADGELPPAAAALYGQQRVNTVEFCIFTGGLRDAELPTQYETFTIADFAGDGRYLVTNGAMLAATALPAGQLHTKIAALLAQHAPANAPEPPAPAEPPTATAAEPPAPIVSTDSGSYNEDEPLVQGRPIIVGGVLTFTTEEEPKPEADYRPRYIREGRQSQPRSW